MSDREPAEANGAVKPPQLRMVWPTSNPRPSQAGGIPAGYAMRQLGDANVSAYIALMDRSGFCGWTAERVAEVRQAILPGGAFVVVHQPLGRPVATALAQHIRHAAHPFGGQLGWVASDPDHRRQGLAEAATIAATRRLVEIGYDDIYLLTDDFRLPAIAMYLKLGWEPVIADEGMADRWAAVRRALG